MLAATVGLLAGAATTDLPEILPGAITLAGLWAVVAAVLWRARSRAGGAAALLAIATAAAVVGAWRMREAEATLLRGRAQVARLAGPLQIRGLVADDPIPRQRITSITLSDVIVRTGEGWEPLGARVLLSVPHWPEHDYGEYLQVTGRLKPLAGDGAIEALGRQGVLASMSYPRVAYLANPQANPVLVAISRLRQRLGETIDRTLPDPASSTLKATILGLSSALPKDEQEALVNTGTVHLIVISGFKLTLIAASLQALGMFVLRRTTSRMWARMVISAAVLATIAGYTLLSGATPSAVRAAIMAGLVVTAAIAGRPHDQLTALGLSVLAMVGARPLLLEDGGLQLSALSVLGIVLLAEPLSARLRRPIQSWPETPRLAGFALAEAIGASAGATLFVLPVLAASFHVVSLVSPLANLLGMPLLWPIMVFGGLGALLGSAWLPAGALLLWPAWAFTSLLQTLVRWTASLPYAALAVDGMAPEAIATYYAGLLTLTWLLRRLRASQERARSKPARRLAWAAMLAGAAAVTGASVVSTRPPDSLRVTFLAVPGQAALIQTADGKKILVDGGESSADLLRQLGSLLPPWDRTLDLVIVTSSRADHVGALAEVFRRYEVRTVVQPAGEAPAFAVRRLSAAPTSPDVVELGEDVRLLRSREGWWIEQGETGVLFGDRSFEVSAPDGRWRIWPMTRGSAARLEGDLLLAETGNVVVTFSR